MKNNTKNNRALTLLGKAAKLRDSHKEIEAAKIYTEILHLDPANTQALYEMAQFLASAGDYKAAHLLSDRLIALVPDHHEALCQAGYIAFSLGDADRAAICYQKALEIRKSPDVCNKIGKLLLDLGYLDKGLVYFQEASSLDPAQPVYGENLVTAYLKVGKFAEGFRVAADLLHRFPERKRVKNYIVSVARSIEVVRYDPALEDIILQCFRQEGIEHQSLVSIWVRTVLLSPVFQEIFSRLGEDAHLWPDQTVEDFLPLMRYEFFRLGLRLVLPNDLRMEAVLTHMRRAMLAKALEDGTACESGVLDFACALSEQGFLNEYVYALADHEEESVRRLKERILSKAEVPSGLDSPQALLAIAVLGCYEPLYRVPALVERFGHAEKLKNMSDSVRNLLVFQVVEPTREAALAAEIPCLGIAEDAVSQKVHEQYEENPYPRWRDAFSESISPGKPEYHKAFDVLVAGCGTGRQILIEKSIYPRARTLAIDLSRASLAYARRKCMEAGIGDVDFMQADILLLDRLERQFDIVFASGVIHHMADPEKALRLLVGRLKPGGVLNLGLYSAAARQDIHLARQDIARQGLSPSAENIRAYRQKIHDRIREGGKYFETVMRSNDFYSLSACRDLLFHVHEVCYSLGEIRRMLGRNGLAFLGFALLEPGVIQRFSKLYPAPEDVLDLEKWEAFEEKHPNSFVSMYQFYVCRAAEAPLAAKAVPLVLGY